MVAIIPPTLVSGFIGPLQFQAMSIDQAMRGLEDEPDLYSEDDLQER